MHGVAPHMCGQVGHPLLDRGAGGRSPGYLATVKANVARIKCPASESNSMTRAGTGGLRISIHGVLVGLDEVGEIAEPGPMRIYLCEMGARTGAPFLRAYRGVRPAQQVARRQSAEA
jgi:hypothetical protein